MMADTTDKLAALLKEYRLGELCHGRVEYNDIEFARWLTERGVGVRGPKPKSHTAWEHQERAVYTVDSMKREISEVLRPKPLVEPSEAAIRAAYDSYYAADGSGTNGELNTALRAAYRAQFTQETGEANE
jgi:hypothetical protein